MSPRITIAGAVLFLLSHHIEASITIDWNHTAGGSVIKPEWIENDIRFTSPGGITHNDSGSSTTSPNNGTPFLTSLLGQSPLVISNLNGALFTLLSVDVAEYSTVFAEPQTVTFTGYRVEGTIISQVFTTDGIIDGLGPLIDFETFNFGPDFNNLYKVTINHPAYALDNMVLRVIPEPSSIILIFAATTAGLLNKRRKIAPYFCPQFHAIKECEHAPPAGRGEAPRP